MNTTIRLLLEETDRVSDKRFTVFTDGDDAKKIAGDWFDTHSIWQLKFKCKAWSKLKREATSISIESMLPVLAERARVPTSAISLKYSDKAGCSCGCSPGYVGKILTDSPWNNPLSKKNVWMDVAAKGWQIEALKAKAERLTDELAIEVQDWDQEQAALNVRAIERRDAERAERENESATCAAL